MAKAKLIALLTDFGLQDIYVGVIKGAIACINPQVQIIDLSHELPPQNITAASFCLLSAYAYFPPETIYVVVVDPGVGSQRRGIAIKWRQGYLVGPDNGLFSQLMEIIPASEIVELTNSKYWWTNHPSQTFHGRDIFAPVAAHLASGISLDELGATIDPASLIKLPQTPLEVTSNQIKGIIQYLDHFGNAITNIPGDLVVNKSWVVNIGEQKMSGVQTYSDRELGALVALIGSHGWIEIAVNGGSAQAKLDLNWQQSLEVRWQS